jgi:hypothetical protein
VANSSVGKHEISGVYGQWFSNVSGRIENRDWLLINDKLKEIGDTGGVVYLNLH